MLTASPPPLHLCSQLLCWPSSLSHLFSRNPTTVLHVLLLLLCLQGMYDPRHPNRLHPAAAAGGGGGAAGDHPLAAAANLGYALKYSGHRNTLPHRNALWMGHRDRYVVSGADDGSLCVWDAATAQIVNVVRGGGQPIKRVQVSELRPCDKTCGVECGAVSDQGCHVAAGGCTAVAAGS